MNLDTLTVAAQDSTVLVVRTILERAPDETLIGLDKSTLFAGAIGIIGVLLGASVTWLVERKARRSTMTYEMHREFFGVEMGDVRTEARARLPMVIDLSFKELDDDQENAKANLPIWKMMRFYQRLAVMMEHNEIHKRLIPDLFGGTFLWWHEVYFKGATAGINWTMAVHMKQLRAYMRAEINSRKRKAWFADLFRKDSVSAKLDSRWKDVWIKEGIEGRDKVVAERIAITPVVPLKAGFKAVLDVEQDV
jgi:hypothetical protein